MPFYFDTDEGDDFGLPPIARSKEKTPKIETEDFAIDLSGLDSLFSEVSALPDISNTENLSASLPEENISQIEQLTEKLGHSPLDIFCVKTGQKIGQRDKVQLLKLATLCRNTGGDVLALTAYLQTNSCAAHWIRTDGKALDELMKIDLPGYLAYTSILLFKPTWERTIEKDAFFHVSLRSRILAYEFYEKLTNTSEALALEVASTLRDFLTVDPSVFVLPWADLPAFFSAVLTGTYQADIGLLIKKFRNSKSEFNRIAFLDKLGKNPGPSNIKSQASAKTTRQLNDIEMIMSRLLADSGVSPFDIFSEPTIAKTYTGTKAPIFTPKKPEKTKAFVLSASIKRGQAGFHNKAKPTNLTDHKTNTINEPKKIVFFTKGK